MTDQRPRLPTGIAGLDEVLGGGLIRGGIYLVMGRAGAGKTVCGNQISFHHAERGERAVYVTLLAETHSRMMMNLERLKFFSRPAIGHGVLYLGGYMQLREKGLPGLLELLRRVLRSDKPSLLVIDGLMTSRLYAPSDVALKEFIIELQVLGAMNDCTVLLLSNMTTSDASGPEHTMVDGLVELRMESVAGQTVRTLEVIKMRGSTHFLGAQEMAITEDGMVVHPGTEERLARKVRPLPPAQGKRSTGVLQLDALLGGGLTAGSVSLALGPTGSGKTILGQHFLSAGDEPSLYYGFHESAERYLSSADALGLPLRRRVDAGALVLRWEPPRRHGLDALAQRLLEDVERGRVERLVIDGLDGFRYASAPLPERLPTYVASLLNELRALGVTVLLTGETGAASGTDLVVGIEGLSALVDNLVVLDTLEVGATQRRILHVVKERGTAHGTAARELRLTAQGLTLAEDSASAEEILAHGVTRSGFGPLRRSPGRSREGY